MVEMAGPGRSGWNEAMTRPLKISRHRLAGHWHTASMDVGAALLEPHYVMLHYTAQGDGVGTRDWMLLSPHRKQRLAGAAAPLYASAHLVIDRDGSIWQIVPFDRQARHAGVSHWRGLTRLNRYAIGIELANYGWLDRHGDGSFGRSDTPRFDPADVVVAPMPHLGEAHLGEDKGWEPFPEVQLTALERVVRALLRRYPTIAEVIGHQDVAPGRKFDPGPAFPMQRFAALLDSRGDDPQRPPERLVARTSLFPRQSPGLVEGALLGEPLAAGTRLERLDSRDGWVYVRPQGDAAAAAFWVRWDAVRPDVPEADASAEA